MAGVVTQILIDGPRNVVSKTTGDNAIGTPITNQTILDPAVLTSMLPGMAGSFPATLLRIDHIDYSISDGITAQLIWDAASPIIICELYGRGKLDPKCYGGFQNNATSPTGKIMLTTTAAEVSAPTLYSVLIVIHAVKNRAGGA
jgi:hypothetical protein